MTALKSEIQARLATVYDPCSVNAGAPLSVIDMGLVTALDLTDDGTVRVTLRPTSPMCTLTGSMAEAIESILAAVDGVTAVEVDVDPSLGWSETSLTTVGRAALEARRAESRSQVPVRRQQWRDRVTGERGVSGGSQA